MTEIKVDQALQVVGGLYNISPTKLRGRRRTAAIVDARHVAIYVLCTTTRRSFTSIGHAIGGRRPDSVSYAFSRISSRLELDPDLKIVVDKAMELIKEV